MVGNLLRNLKIRDPLPVSRFPGPEEWPRLVKRCQLNPTDPEIHLELARHFLRLEQPLPSYACYRTAQALGAPSDPILAKIYFSENITVPDGLSENGSMPAATTRAQMLLEYQRLARVADRVNTLFAGRRGTLVDVGGGTGALALLLPNCHYFLAEPAINGLTSSDAARFGRRFDIVTCSHVLEHIPEDKKLAFLEDLLALSGGHVVLLGPTIDALPRPPVDEVFAQITKQGWAQEHLACGWPKVTDLRALAARHGANFTAEPNGNLAATYWMVFAYHYAALAGRERELTEITSAYNAKVCPDPLAPPPPNDYLVEYRVRPSL